MKLKYRNLQIRPSTIKGAGCGLFTDLSIKNGEVVFENPIVYTEYKYEAFTAEQLSVLKEHNFYNDDARLIIAKEDIESEFVTRTPDYYLNHAEDPNCFFIESKCADKITYVVKARKDIKAGEELFINYNFSRVLIDI
jgi:hypothetical protein